MTELLTVAGAKSLEHKYIEEKNLKVYCATWNVNNRCYQDCPLRLWLSACKSPPDIYAIGFQELGMSPLTIAMSETRPNSDWIDALLGSLHLWGNYEELDSVRLVGMMLTVIVRKDLRPFIKHHHMSRMTRGLCNMLGNKGAVAVSMQLYETSICFVNTHLAAHMDKVADRNDDYTGIMNELQFEDSLIRNISEHENIFWFGDLNYRLEESSELPINSAAENYQHLLEYDQLTQEMRKHNCFLGFREGVIKFSPTYKYDVGTDTYDTSEKQRPPAYCDRILWKGPHIEQLSYNSVMELRQSDHKPVYALFIVKVNAINEERYKRLHQPQIVVDKPVVDFGLVHFNDMAESVFKVSNSSAVIVNIWFNFKQPEGNHICEQWLEVDPKKYILPVGATKDIRVTLHIDERTIRGLLKRMRTTETSFDFDVLNLHVHKGDDVIITVTGEYKPSCYGLSMDTLCLTNRPVADYTQAELKELMNDVSTEFRVPMPREFFLLIDYLRSQGEHDGKLFTSMGRYSHYNEVREWLDTWSYNKFPTTPQVAADALFTFLDLPEEPLLYPFVSNLLAAHTMAEAAQYISLLSTPRRNAFMHLCMFLREGIKSPAYDLPQIALIFGRVLLRDELFNGDEWDQRRREFMHQFISFDFSTLIEQHADLSS